MVNERQAAGVERITKIIVRDGKQSVTYQVKTGFGIVYCSTDGVTWQGPQQYECSGPTRIYGRREIESAEYSVEETTVGDENVKIYREFVTYKRTEDSVRDLKETIATIDSRGGFVSIVNREGTLDPKTINLIRKQSWDFTSKFKPIVAPK